MRRIRVITEADLERRPWLLNEVDELSHLLFVQRGVLTTAQALTHLSLGAVRHLVRRGDWLHAHHGVYVVGSTPLTEEQRRWVAVLAAGDGGLLAGRTALAALCMSGFPCSSIHIIVPAARRYRRPPAGVVVHRSRVLPGGHIAGGQPPCTSADRSLVDAVSWARTEPEAYTVIAMAFQQRLVTLDGVEGVLTTMTQVKRRKLIRQGASLAAGGAHSLSELRLPRLLEQAGLPAPTLQKERIDADGRRRYLDLYFEEWRLHVEIDGAHHFDARQAWADADRQNKLWMQGDRVLRFPAWIVLERPQEVVQQIRAALTAAGWRP